MADDPCNVLHRYAAPRDTEVAAFIMALLSFGQREQFLKKAAFIFSRAGNHPATWLKTGKWQMDFPHGTEKFYRFYSYNDVRAVFSTLQKILLAYVTFGEAVRVAYDRQIAAQRQPSRAPHCSDNRRMCSAAETHSGALVAAIISLFPDCRMVSRGKQSAHKRLHLFLRWMVRTGSPVDVGLWTWYSPADLIIPLDTHVLATAIALGLVPKNSRATAQTACRLTAVLRDVWPNDPCRGDFALFGAGVAGKAAAFCE
ncbi:MAG: TIGR02757 family protein [Treponema sp.]|nr:TIGR02757 family protein [Treponema sp.]